MEAYSAKKIAEIVGGKIICGDETRLITEVSTNSKLGDSKTLFVPIIGERVDAHDFIKDAYENGMRVTFTMREKEEQDTSDMTYISVKSTLDALQLLGAYYREQFNVPVIGVTGSVGKTTTKEMIAAALSVKYNVLKTIGNMNSQIGLPQMMLKLAKEYDIAVIEMGMSLPGEMERLAKIAKPNMAVITNIGVSHIGQLGSKENIREAKMNIINEFTKGSKLFINGEDELLYEVYHSYGEEKDGSLSQDENGKIKVSADTNKALSDATMKAFGLRHDFTYYGTNIRYDKEKTYFNFCIKNLNGETQEEEIVLQVLGMHNVLNAIVALAVAHEYGIEPMDAKKGLYEYQPISMRGVIEKIQGITLVDDTYNASPDSMKSAVDVLLALKEVNRRIAVFADVLELGSLSKQCHYEVGTYLANKNIDLVITIGKEAAYIADGIKDNGSDVAVKEFSNNKDATTYICQELMTGDAIILKGSRGMHLDHVVAAIKEKFC